MWRKVIPIVTGSALASGPSTVAQMTKLQSQLGERRRRIVLAYIDLDFNFDWTTTAAGTVTLSDMGRIISEINAKVRGWDNPSYQCSAKQLRLMTLLTRGRVTFTDPATVPVSSTNALRTFRVRLRYAGAAGESLFDTAIDPMAFEDLTLTRDNGAIPANSTLNSLSVDVRATFYEWHKGSIPQQFCIRGKNLTAADRIEVPGSDGLLCLFMENNADSFTASDTYKLTDGRGRLAHEQIRFDDSIEESNSENIYDAASDLSSSSPTVVPFLWVARSGKGAGNLELSQLAKMYDNRRGTVVELLNTITAGRFVAFHIYNAQRDNERGRSYIREGLNRDPDSFRSQPQARKALTVASDRTRVVPSEITPIQR